MQPQLLNLQASSYSQLSKTETWQHQLHQLRSTNCTHVEFTRTIAKEKLADKEILLGNFAESFIEQLKQNPERKLSDWLQQFYQAQVEPLASKEDGFKVAVHGLFHYRWLPTVASRGIAKSLALITLGTLMQKLDSADLPQFLASWFDSDGKLQVAVLREYLRQQLQQAGHTQAVDYLIHAYTLVCDNPRYFSSIAWDRKTSSLILGKANAWFDYSLQVKLSHEELTNCSPLPTPIQTQFKLPDLSGWKAQVNELEFRHRERLQKNLNLGQINTLLGVSWMQREEGGALKNLTDPIQRLFYLVAGGSIWSTEGPSGSWPLVVAADEQLQPILNRINQARDLLRSSDWDKLTREVEQSSNRKLALLAPILREFNWQNQTLFDASIDLSQALTVSALATKLCLNADQLLNYISQGLMTESNRISHRELINKLVPALQARQELLLSLILKPEEEDLLSCDQQNLSVKLRMDLAEFKQSQPRLKLAWEELSEEVSLQQGRQSNSRSDLASQNLTKQVAYELCTYWISLKANCETRIRILTNLQKVISLYLSNESKAASVITSLTRKLGIENELFHGLTTVIEQFKHLEQQNYARYLYNRLINSLNALARFDADVVKCSEQILWKYYSMLEQQITKVART